METQNFLTQKFTFTLPNVTSEELTSSDLTCEHLETLKERLETSSEKDGRIDFICQIDASDHNFSTIRNLINIFLSHESLICKSLGISTKIASKLHSINKSIALKIDAGKIDDLKAKWDLINKDNDNYKFGIDLSRWLSDKKISFKYTLNCIDVNLITGLISMSLAINSRALVLRRASLNIKKIENEKFTMRTWLNRIGIKGLRFKGERKALLKNLKGDSAWSSGFRPEVS